MWFIVDPDDIMRYTTVFLKSSIVHENVHMWIFNKFIITSLNKLIKIFFKIL